VANETHLSRYLAHVFALQDYTGKPFRLFGRSHVVALSVLAVLTLALFGLNHVSAPEVHLFVRYALLSIMIASEIGSHLWHRHLGEWRLQKILPLHLCTFTGNLCIILLIAPQYYLWEFVYFMGLCAASQSLFTPQIGRYGFPHYEYFRNFIWHGGIVIVSVYVMIMEGYRPTWMSLLRVGLEINIYILSVLWLNRRLGSNYMFLTQKPVMPTILDSFGPWPWYIVEMELMGAVVVLLLYVPFLFV